MKRYLLVLTFIIICFTVSAQSSAGIFHVKKLGKTIYEGVFTGNGLLGSMTYIKSGNSVRVDVGRTDVYDHRTNNESALFDKARLNIGHVEVIVSDTILDASGEINYKKAEALAIISTKNGGLYIRTLTLAHRDVIYLEITGFGNSAPAYQVKWEPEKAISPRMNFSHVQPPKNYPPNPAGILKKDKDIQIYEQPLLAGGGYATVLKKEKKGEKQIYLVSIGYSTQSGYYTKEALHNIRSVNIKDIDAEIQAHRKWWNNYYSASGLSVPDENIQQFYNMQMYKLGSASRKDKPALDLQGPWTASTPWPAYWHNLNIQLTYSPAFTANRLDVAGSLIQMIDRNTENLVNNVPQKYRYNSAAIGRSSGPDMKSPVYLEKEIIESGRGGDGGKELGNLTWILHSYYQYYRFSMDSKVYDNLFSLLKRSVNYYLHLLELNGEGKYHIAVKTYSPEYPKAYVFDTNYDLAILRWGLKALISLDNERGGTDPLHARWDEVLNNLRDYPKNEDGFMIGKDFPYAESHRHYSHLMMIYPFYDVNWDQQENRELITRSIAYWQSKNKYLQGYSFSGAASMYAMMGKGNEAVRSLNILLDKYIKPNTLYAETGPVIETPLAAMSSIQELCIQYWDSMVRIFPAVPDAWGNVSFRDFLTDGAFLISAERQEGKTRKISVKSRHTGILKLKTGIPDPRVAIKGNGKVIQQTEEYIELYLEEGATAAILAE